MTAFWFAYGVLTGSIAVSAWLIIWSRRDTWLRGAVIVGFMLALPTVAALLLNVHGLHRPMVWEKALHGFRGIDNPRIMAVKMIQGRGIFLYLDTDGPPLALVLPWDMELAQQIEDTMREHGANTQLRLPYEFSWDTNPPEAWAPPQPKILLDKPRDEPVEYERET